MLLVMRRGKIKDILLERKSVTVAKLAEIFQVTEETIRRDLTALEKEGFLTRTHGGAFIQGGVQNDVLSSLRENAFIDNKRTIAQRAKILVGNGDSIYLDHSTTCYYIAEAIRDMRITVLTNNFKIITLLSKFPNINLIAIGGIFSEHSMAFLGTTALQTLNTYYVDKAFISCRTISITNGVTDSTEPSADIRRKVIERAYSTFLVLDYSKFDSTSFIKICELKNLHSLITDKPLPDNWRAALHKANVPFIDSH